MSKKMARKLIASEKPGCTVKEFLTMCDDMGTWFDLILDTDLELAYYALTKKEGRL